MAKNWTVAEAVEAILAGDQAAIADLGKRFPRMTVAIAKMGTNEGALELIKALPEHVTIRKLEANAKDGMEDEVEDTDSDEDSEDEATPKRGRKAASDDDKKAKAKARREARKAAKAKAEAEDDEDEEESEDQEEEAEEVDYSGMNAVELFKLCKKRGITCQPKQKTKVYIDLLKAADEDAEYQDEEEDDDWGEEEEEAPKKKPGRPAKKAKEEKPAKKAAKAEDDDDDWDI